MRILILLLMLTASHVTYGSEATDIMIEILIELNHFPNEDDHSFLDEILEGSEASEEEKALAAAIKRIAHKPAAEDVAVLRGIENNSTDETMRTIASAILSINHQPSETYLKKLNEIIDDQ